MSVHNINPERESTKCHFCANTVKRDANFCSFCGAYRAIEPIPPQIIMSFNRLIKRNYMSPWATGIITTISIFILIILFPLSLPVLFLLFLINRAVKCPACSNRIIKRIADDPLNMFCYHCGTRLREGMEIRSGYTHPSGQRLKSSHCGFCGSDIAGDDRFCAKCGANVSEPTPPRSLELPGERYEHVCEFCRTNISRLTQSKFYLDYCPACGLRIIEDPPDEDT